MLLKDLDPRLRRMIIQAIRKWFVYSDKYKQVKNRAKVEKPVKKKDGAWSKRKSVSYRCASCKELFKSNEVEVDHKIPVIALFNSSSNMTLSQYIQKVDCPINNLNVLCKKCHKEKTKKENDKRVKTDKKGNILKTRKKTKK